MTKKAKAPSRTADSALPGDLDRNALVDRIIGSITRVNSGPSGSMRGSLRFWGGAGAPRPSGI